MNIIWGRMRATSISN